LKTFRISAKIDAEMKIWLLPFLLFAVLAGCARHNARSMTGASFHGLFITNYGRNDTEGGLSVNISEPDGKLEIRRSQYFDVLTATNPANGQVSVAHNASVTNLYSNEGWKAQKGWFVFVQNDTQIWAYDGNRFLWLLRMDKSGNSWSYGPRTFPCKVPANVLNRISADAKNQIMSQSNGS